MSRPFRDEPKIDLSLDILYYSELKIKKNSLSSRASLHKIYYKMIMEKEDLKTEENKNFLMKREDTSDLSNKRDKVVQNDK